MNKIIPGDKIEITVDMKDFKINTDLVISLIKDNKLITCGHCLPENAILSFGKIIYTSGFDNPNEKYEIGIIKIFDKMKQSFSNKIHNKVLNLNKKKLELNTKIFNYCNRKKIFGRIISINKNNLNGWHFHHAITKLTKPYYLVVGLKSTIDEELSDSIKKNFKINSKNKFVYKLTTSGYSGSPWIYESNGKLYHIGIHIGKTTGSFNGKLYEIAYVKPLI